MKINSFIFTLFICLILGLVGCDNKPARKTLNLNGTWDFEATNNPEMPVNFSRKIPVPGLVDLAEPSIDKPGTRKDSAMFFWYRTKFTLEKNSEVCLLKIFKAQYGKKIFVNNHFVAEHFPSYTPITIDIKEFLNESGKENEIVIRLGNYYNFPDSFVNGHDFEKAQYISGIYDNVEIIQSAFPFVQNVQIAPDIHKGTIKVLTELNTKGRSGNYTVKYIISEHKSGNKVAEGEAEILSSGAVDTSRIEISIPEMKLWGPEDPFLYNLTVKTDADEFKTRFGMREFRFDKKLGRALLNDKVFYMKGTNVPLFRFFEDSLRGKLPWDKEWVTKLYNQFSSMHWNVVRFHVGPAPEFWYDLADEMGFIIHDEFPIWFSFAGIETMRPNMKAHHIAAEYKDWMRERWNHPCVVIWDAQNETVTKETGKAINMVRHLDISNRPWDNGWSRPQAEADAIESHPYLFWEYSKKDVKIPAEGILKNMFSVIRQPSNDPGDHDKGPNGEKYDNVRFINEYGWLWVNRDGSPTTLSAQVYKYLFDGDTLTNEERLYWYARIEAMLTEYWRSVRTGTGVLHFAGLTYSRTQEPRGQTCDNFKDVTTLEFDPNFVKYVKPAFAPVGLMIESWEKEYKAGQEMQIPVHIINDLYTDWEGDISFAITKDNQVIDSQIVKVKLASLGKASENFKIRIPALAGKYQMEASLMLNNEKVFSIRDVLVK